MEENIIMSNIATIITKDVIIDESKNQKKRKTLLGINKRKHEFPLLEFDDDEDIKFCLHQQKLFFNKTKRSLKKKRAKSPQNENQAKSKDRIYPLINLLNSYDVNMFEGHLHLSKLSFLYMFQVIKNLMCAKKFPMVIAMQSVFSLSLWKLTTDEHFEVISSKFNIPLLDCKLIIHTFWNIISDNYEQFIKWPNSQEAQIQTITGFQADPKLNIFEQMFGVITLKRLNVFLDHVDGEVSVILQIICNADKKIIDCYVEHAENYSFESTPIGHILETNDLTIPKNCYLVGDHHFPVKSYLICPITSPCFRREHAFNKLLLPVCEFAQEVLDTIAKRFNILYALEAKDLHQVRTIVDTVCALHNVCVDIEDDYVARKREIVTFNWANIEDNIKIKLKPINDKEGQRRRELMEAIVK